MSNTSLAPHASSSARITFKGLWRSCPGLIMLMLFLIIWLGLGYTGAEALLSAPEPGRILITQHGFRSTGAIIESDPTSYDNPGSTSISAGNTVTFKNSSSQTIRLCLEQHGECSASAEGPASLRFPGMMLIPEQSTEVLFPAAGDYPIMVYTNDTAFKYNTLTVTVREDD